MGQLTLSEAEMSVVKSSVLFAEMSAHDIAGILARARLTDFKRGAYLFDAQQDAEDFFLILDGWVQILREEQDGSRTLITVFAKGESIAEAPAFLGRTYPVSAQAMTGVRALSVPGPAFLDLMQANRSVLAASMASMYQKLHDLVGEVEVLKSRTIRERLIGFLLSTSGGQNGRVELQLPYDKSLIAAKIGTSPEQLSRTFADLRNFGVKISGRHAVIDDADALRQLLGKN